MSKKNQYKADSKLEAQIAFILGRAGVTGPEIDECIAWAFGPGAWYVPISPDWVLRWNKLHPYHPMKLKDRFVDTMFGVGCLFVSYKKWQAKTGQN